MNRNHVFDSNGPDMRLRGTAQQLFEKYLQLGRDATSASDRVMAESYFQHAEHYFRILNAMSQAAQAQGGPPQHQQRRYQNGPEQEGGGDGNSDQPDLAMRRDDSGMAQQINAPQYGNGHADRNMGDRGMGDRGMGDRGMDDRGNGMDQDDNQSDMRDRDHDRDQREG